VRELVESIACKYCSRVRRVVRRRSQCEYAGKYVRSVADGETTPSAQEPLPIFSCGVFVPSQQKSTATPLPAEPSEESSYRLRNFLKCEDDNPIPGWLGRGHAAGSETAYEHEYFGIRPWELDRRFLPHSDLVTAGR